MTTVYDFLHMFLEEDDQHVKVFSLGKEEEIYQGTLVDMPEEVQDMEIASFDTMYSPDTYITINVE